METIATDIEKQMIDYYYKAALQETGPEDFKARYFKTRRN